MVEQNVYQYPPAHLLDICDITRTDLSIEGELRRQARVIDCERGDKEAIRVWIEETGAITGGPVD